MIFFWINSVDFWRWKLTLKVQIWHHFMNRNSSMDFKKSFEYVDSWPKILLFWTHNLQNSVTELTLLCTYPYNELKKCSMLNVIRKNLVPFLTSTQHFQHWERDLSCLVLSRNLSDFVSVGKNFTTYNLQLVT